MQTGTLSFPAIERIIYGTPAAEALRREVARLDARRVFMIVSGTMNRKTDEIEKVRAALGERCAAVFDGIAPHIPMDAALHAAAEARAVEADLIVTFGGGSVTGAGKVVQVCLANNVRDAEHLKRLRIVVNADGTDSVPVLRAPTVRQIAIPTTLSAGEYNAQGGCTDLVNKVKTTFRHPLMVPRVTILDPLPTVHTPLWVWISTGIRAVDHAVEGLCSTSANPISDATFVRALELLGSGLRRVKQMPDDMAARLDCQMGVWLSMAGRQGGAQMGASHAIGHVLGGACNVPHGYTSCVMLPHVLRYNSSVNAGRQQIVSTALGQPGAQSADVVASFLTELEMPQRLSEVGVNPEQFGMIADKAMHDSWLHTNPRKITAREQVMEILRAAA